jgi:hypothetical protein
MAPRLGKGTGPFFSRCSGTASVQEIIVAKEHRRGNREARKPKKLKEAIPPPVALIKDVTASTKTPKRS